MMKRFRGTYEHTLDAKGRVAVPKKFREELLGLREDYVGAELVVTYGLSGQLFVFSPEGFDDFAARYGALPGGDADLLDRFFGASARECALDGQGRILVAPLLKSFAGLEKDVVWVGQRGHVELWSASRWQEAQEAVMQGVFTASSENLKQAYDRIDFNAPITG
jgi:MraZ protein